MGEGSVGLFCNIVEICKHIYFVYISKLIYLLKYHFAVKNYRQYIMYISQFDLSINKFSSFPQDQYLIIVNILFRNTLPAPYISQ